MDKARVMTLFIGVVRARSFSQAAVEAGLTPQAVSKAVRQLEDHLGVRLFHRTTRSLSLTDEGQRLFELANPGLRLLDEAFDQVQNSRREVDGLIRIAAPTSFGTHFLAPLLCSFQQQYPGASFDLQLSDQFQDLIEGRIDVGFRAGHPPERNLVSRHIGDITLQICAAPSYIERHGAPRTAQELLQHRCTGFRQPNTGRLVPWELRGEGGTVYMDVPCVATFSTAEAEVEAVRAGMGIGQLATYMLGGDVAQGRLVHLLPELDTSNAGVYMYYQQRNRMPLRVRHFIDHVIAASQGAFTAARRRN
ncbi:LysR family transcriptional regulator [Massilia endophytica]|uniref:LysR family transcriptional regulator n=1 Tax=Massilia endophytica TaxID=2899220 RepID=UPI001E3B4FA0|nr:LysR family transcriptional regulator [Massilia endophytica]UGQ45538.1 LysR family transcriptional regulator [Massilia endophytica]